MSFEVGTSEQPLTRLWIPNRGGFSPDQRGVVDRFNLLAEDAHLFKVLAYGWMGRLESNESVESLLNDIPAGLDSARQIFDLISYKSRSIEGVDLTADNLELKKQNEEYDGIILSEFPELYRKMKRVIVRENNPIVIRQMSSNFPDALHNPFNFLAGIVSIDTGYHRGGVNRAQEARDLLISGIDQTKSSLQRVDNRILNEVETTNYSSVELFDKLCDGFVSVLKPVLSPDSVEILLRDNLRINSDYADLETRFSEELVSDFIQNVAPNAVTSFERRDRIQPDRSSEPKIVILDCRTDLQNKSFKITITDTGSGFAPEILADGFREGITTEIGIGHGIGMAGIQKLFNKLGIKIELANTYQNGRVTGAIQSFTFPISN